MKSLRERLALMLAPWLAPKPPSYWLNDATKFTSNSTGNVTYTWVN
jgi:hypothetical protein